MQPGYRFEDLTVGMQASYRKTITEEDILLFAQLSGDTNPLHMDKDYARSTHFKGRIAHGLLTASLISTVLGTKLPGEGCIYVSQNLKFKEPVRIGHTIEAKATVKELNAERNFVTLTTNCTVSGTLVLEGECVMYVPSRKP